MPDTLLLAALAALVGAGAGWLLARGHERARARAEQADLQARAASAAALAEERARQVTQREAALADARRIADSERSLRAGAETRLDEARRSVDEQKRLLDLARAQLTDAFKALSADALRESAADFLRLAEAQLGQRQAAIDASLKPLEETLHRYEEHVRELEASRRQDYGGLDQQIRALSEQTGQLVGALRGPQARGRWGEITLRRVVELAGMTAYCDYAEQVTVGGDGGRLRPDMIVHLPNGRDIVVDAKTPLTAYDALVRATPEERPAALVRHAQQVRQHMSALAGKEYASQFPSAPELVVMFIPLESVVAAAVEADPTLLEDGVQKGIVVATPTTLVALLRAIAYGWRQERLATNAAEINELGRELHRRLTTFLAHVERVGVSLAGATSAFNAAVGSLEARVLPAARRFRELGATGGEEIKPLGSVDAVPRRLAAPELPPDDGPAAPAETEGP